jgi:hypothetical protein
MRFDGDSVTMAVRRIRLQPIADAENVSGPQRRRWRLLSERETRTT